MHSRVIHFEILAANPERVARFYKEAFGWEVNAWGGAKDYLLLSTGPRGTPGIDGAVMGKSHPQAVINTLQVESLDKALAAVEKAGGKKVHGPNEIPGVGTHAYCQDPEGGMFGLLQPAAK